MRPLARWPWTFMLAAGLCVGQARGDARAPEYQLKAAFIYKFATYIRWPATTGADGTRPFVIGVIGNDPFGRALDAVMQGQSVQGKPIIVRRVAEMEDAPGCDVLFVSASERGHLRQIFAAVRGAPVLTVSDMDQFAELGGMINLVTTEDNHLRFDINKGAIDRAGLKAPSQLLRLARIVDELRADGAER
jgi:hypothetical protein